MSEGELKKQIEHQRKMHNSVKFQRKWQIEASLNAISDSLYEAKKEFPVKGFRMENEEHPLITVTEHLEFDIPTPEEFIQILQWFKKWFGSIEP